MLAPPDCARCPRLVGSRKVVVNGFGPLPASIWLVGQGPGREEEKQGRPLCGWSGERVDYLLELAGVDPSTVRRENITRCRPPRGPKGDLPPTPEEIRSCAPFLTEALAEHPPRYIVALGAPAAKWFLSDCKISQDHGRAFPWGNATVVPMYHPAAAHPSRNPSLSTIIIEDWKRFGEFLRQGIVPDTRDYRRVTEGELAEYLAGAPEFAFDFETTDPTWQGTFQPMMARIIGVSVSANPNEGVYYFGNFLPECLRQALENPAIRKFAHNAIFEYIVARQHGARPQNLHCTKLMAYCLRTSTTYLKGLTWTQLGVDQTRFDQVDWDDDEAVVNYGGADSALTYTLAPRFLAALVQEGLTELYEVERQALPALGEMAIRGVLLDPAPLRALASELRIELPVLEQTITDHFGALPGDLNLNSTDHLIRMLYGPKRWTCTIENGYQGRIMHDPDCTRKACEGIACAGGIRTGAMTMLKWWPPGLAWPVKDRTPTGQPATDMNTLRLYEGEPIVGDLVKYKSIQRVLRNDLEKLPALRHSDQRIHPTFHQAGRWEERQYEGESPMTGRFSSSGPNLQNITHHGDNARPYVAEWAVHIRRGFVAPPGMTLIKGDIGQEEPRIGALIANDPELLQEFTSGDVYCPVASLAFNRHITKGDVEERQIGKRMWMAWLNGAGPAGIQQSAYWLNNSEARQVVKYLANRHPKVEVARKALVEHLVEMGYTETWFGRRVYRPEIWSGPGPARNHAERSVMPDRIQGTAADVMKIWLGRLALPPESHLLLTVHDELLVECPPERIQETCEALRQGLVGILPIPLPLELATGPNWADMARLD